MSLKHKKRYGRCIREELEDLGAIFDFEGVKDLISDLRYLKYNHIYDQFFDIFKNWEDPVNVSAGMHKELQSISPLLTRAISNGLTPQNGNIFSSSIDYFSFYHAYRFLEWIYSMNLGRHLHKEDVKAIFSSDILEKIILGLKSFDQMRSTDNFDDSFFYHINEVKWTDKYTENFFDNLHDLLASKSFNEIGNREISFQRELKRVVKFLAVCSTLSGQRIYITSTDIIIAYKTLFKIIRIGITDFVNKKSYKGVLTCSKCNGYYDLQEEEIPDDFIQCSCGGALTYVMSPEEVKSNPENFKIVEKGLVAGALISLIFALVFDSALLIALLSGIVTVLTAKNYTDSFKYGFLAGNISGSLFFIAVFLFGIILSEFNLNQLSSINQSIIFIFIVVLGVLTIYCGRIGIFLVKGFKNDNIQHNAR